MVGLKVISISNALRPDISNSFLGFCLQAQAEMVSKILIGNKFLCTPSNGDLSKLTPVLEDTKLFSKLC
jgi:hypothetical protein